MFEKKTQFSLSNAEIQRHKNNRTLRKTVKSLLHRLLHQFRSESYQSNSILHQFHTELTKTKEQLTKQIQLIENMDKDSLKESNGSDNQEGKIEKIQKLTVDYIEITDVLKIWEQISIFIWQLGYSPKCYAEMFQNEEIHAEESQVIDMHIFTSKIYKKVMKKCFLFTYYTKIFQQIAADQIYFFLEQVSSQICLCFVRGRKIVIREVEQTTDAVQKSKIINFYVLFKIFKDVAVRCKQLISLQLQNGLFRNVQTECVNTFTLYIIEKYQLLKLQMKKDEENLKELQLSKKQSAVEMIMNSNNVKWREAVGEDGQIGILVELQEKSGEDEPNKKHNYMLLLDEQGQIKIMHCNSLHKKWKVCKQAEKNYDVMNLIKNKRALAARFRGGPTAQQLHKMTFVDNINVVGGTMGRTLAQIDQFESAGQFISVLSKRMIIGGSLNYMIYSIPLLGYIFITGGYTYSFYYIFNNKYANKNKKLRQIRNMTIGAASSVGSGLLGAAIGQTLIPVPILGAFIGGFVGGFVGQLGCRAVGDVLQTSRFKQTIQEMSVTIQPKGYWQINKRTLKILQIKQQKFYQTIPSNLEHKMNCDRIWMTLIFFTLLTFDESEKRVKYMDKRLKDMKKYDKFQIIDEDFDMYKKDQYQPSMNILCIMKYFEENGIYFLDYHDVLADIIGKMFSRLK